MGSKSQNVTYLKPVLPLSINKKAALSGDFASRRVVPAHRCFLIH